MSIMILDSNFRKDNKINGENLIDPLILRIKNLLLHPIPKSIYETTFFLI